MRAEEIIKLIKESKKRTPTKAFISGHFEGCAWGALTFIGGDHFGLLIGDYKEVESALSANASRINAVHIEVEPVTLLFHWPISPNMRLELNQVPLSAIW